MTLGERILQLRKSTGLSQEQLAEMVGVSRQAISKWETDQSAPDIEKVLLLSKTFSISTDELLGNESVNKNESSEEEPSARVIDAEAPSPQLIGVAKHNDKKRLVILNWITFGTGLLGISTLLILSFIMPSTKWTSSGEAIRWGEEVHGDLGAFFETYKSAGFLFAVCCVLLLIGIAMLLKEKLHQVLVNENSKVLSIISLILGIVAIPFACLGIWVIIPAGSGLIFSIFSLSKKRVGKGMTLAGLILSSIALFMAIIIAAVKNILPINF